MRLRLFPLSVLAAQLAPLASALASGAVTVVDMPVVSVTPVVEQVSERIPHEYCRRERVRVVERHRGHSMTPSIIGAVVGGAAGAVLGENSRNRGIIAGAGAVLGASVAHDIGHQRRRSSRYVMEDVCEVEYELRTHERVSGYRVRYRFGDTIQETHTALDPGETIAVRVELEPLS